MNSRRDEGDPAVGRRRKRMWRVVATLVAAAGLSGTLTSTASAGSWIIYNFDMFTDVVNTYGGCVFPTGTQTYRWTDTPPTSSRISNNQCSNLNSYTYADFGQHTEYRTVGNWNYGEIVLRGRSLGTINCYNHDGVWNF